MALPTTLAAYTDCLELFDRAQSSKSGIRIFRPNQGSAFYLRNRLHQARALDRKESTRLYDRDHPAYNKSLHDKFVVRTLPSAEGDGYWVYIEPWDQTIGEVEEL